MKSGVLILAEPGTTGNTGDLRGRANGMRKIPAECEVYHKAREGLDSS